ncbi:MAG: hypothetical protein LBB84_09820 [Tannerellaceae bacterium]|nr:hypothetical protein [Tannerellaceae bacterium]
MKKLLSNLFFLMFAAVASLQAQSKQTSIIVFEPKEVSSIILDPSLKTQLREEINRTVMDNSTAYRLVEWSIISTLVDVIIQTTGSPVFDEEKVVEIGKMSGAEKVIYTEVLSSSDGFYQVYSKQLDVATGFAEKYGSGQIRCKAYLHLAARQAASVFAKDPESALQKVEKDIKKACPEETHPRPPRKNLLRELLSVKMKPVQFGLTLSYDQRERRWEDLAAGTTESFDYWGRPSLLGARLGFRYDRYLAPKYIGLGISTGLLAEYYSLNSKVSSEEEESLRFREISLRVPVSAMYRIDFTEHIGCFIAYGLYADVGIYSRMDVGDEVYANVYDEGTLGAHMKRFRYGTFCEAGIQTDHLMLGASVGQSLSNPSDDPLGKIHERNFSLNLTLMF